MPPTRNLLPLAAVIIAGIIAVTLMVLFHAPDGLVITVATMMLITVPTTFLASQQGQAQGKLDSMQTQTNGHQSELVALVRDLSQRQDETGRLLASMHPPAPPTTYPAATPPPEVPPPAA